MSEESSESHELDDEYVESTCLPRSAFDDFLRDIEGPRLHHSQLEEINNDAPLLGQWRAEQCMAEFAQSQEQRAAEFAGQHQATWAHHLAIEVEAARLADVCRKSTGLERESNIRQLREAESDLEQFRDSFEFQEALNYTVQAMAARTEVSSGADKNLMAMLDYLQCLQAHLAGPKPVQFPLQMEAPEPSTVAAVPAPVIERRKRNVLIKELIGIWPSIKCDLSDGSRASSGLSKAAKLGGTFWDLNKAITWAVERGKITKKRAEQSVATEPDSVFAATLRQLFKF